MDAAPATVRPPADALVLLADLDPALQPLLAEWLADAGYEVGFAVESGRGTGRAAALVVVDLPHPRHANGRLQALAARWPGTPVLAMSSAFFASVPVRGELARSLGVAGVLPAPVSREALLATVRELVAGGR